MDTLCRAARMARKEEKFLRVLHSWGKGEMCCEMGAAAIASGTLDWQLPLKGQMLSLGTLTTKDHLCKRRIPTQQREGARKAVSLAAQ